MLTRPSAPRRRGLLPAVLGILAIIATPLAVVLLFEMLR